MKTYSAKEIINKLKKVGFEVIRIKGSHYYLRHPDGRATVIPVHSNEDISIGLFLKILKDIEISKDDFEKNLK
ncbi:MAG TPA: type II toxin-antitoxin system HicA family toxin [Candidatus Kapabacteria bacterium]|nr:type II toxin-antitoxin system HicA family toxin [Candidatus Kapabacteria bacterium]